MLPSGLRRRRSVPILMQLATAHQLGSIVRPSDYAPVLLPWQPPGRYAKAGASPSLHTCRLHAEQGPLPLHLGTSWLSRQVLSQPTLAHERRRRADGGGLARLPPSTYKHRQDHQICNNTYIIIYNLA